MIAEEAPCSRTRHGRSRAMWGQRHRDPLRHGLVHVQHDGQGLEPDRTRQLRCTRLPNTVAKLPDHRHEPMAIIREPPDALCPAVIEREPGRSYLKVYAPLRPRDGHPRRGGMMGV